MVEEILAPVRNGKRVCAVFYGHPGVYVNPSHEAVRRAREEGYEARMFPAVSAEDCLVADLGVDPGERGWQSWDATGFLLRRVRPDPTAGLVLWQVDAIGKLDWDLDPNPRGLRALGEVLAELYPPEHELVFYRASIYPILDGEATRVPLQELAALESPPAATLYVPPLPPGPVNAAMAARIGITRS
jgi:Tetrapyrrole (Corrin/Porphyrin) Methylases